MNALRRAWRVYADPSGSEAALVLKWMIPLDFAAWHYRMFAPEDWPALFGTTLVQVLMWCALLWFVRERDAAKAESAALRGKAEAYDVVVHAMPLVADAVARRRGQ